MYTMTLADGTEITFSGMNGTNYITPDKTPIDISVFTDANLASGTITDPDGNTTEFANWQFIQQQKQLDGSYYVAFWQKTAQQVADEARDAYISTLEDAILDIYEGKI